MNKHWSENETLRRQFWGVARNQFDMDEVMVKKVLGISSLADFDGSSEEALQLLEDSGPDIHWEGEIQ